MTRAQRATYRSIGRLVGIITDTVCGGLEPKILLKSEESREAR